MRIITVAAIALSTAGIAHAQTQSEPALIPNIGNFTLPAAGPQITPRPTPTPTTAPSSTIAPPPVTLTGPIQTPGATPAPAPRRSAARTPEPAPAASPSPEPTASPSPVVTPTPDASSIPEPLATPAAAPIEPVAVATPEAPAPADVPWAWLALAVVLLAGAAFWLLRRRRARAEAWVEESAPAAPRPTPPAATPPLPRPAPAATPPGDRPWLELGFTPKRAGTNLTSAAVEYQLTLTNIGKAEARGIRVAGELLGASSNQDAEIVALYDDTIDLPLVPPFALAPGEARAIDGFASRTRDRLEAIPVQGRPMFVPIVAIRARYGYGEDSAGLATATYVVGVERDGAARMGPIWLDQPPRMRSDVGARPYTAGKAGVRRIGTPQRA